MSFLYTGLLCGGDGGWRYEPKQDYTSRTGEVVKATGYTFEGKTIEDIVTGFSRSDSETKDCLTGRAKTVSKIICKSGVFTYFPYDGWTSQKLDSYISNTGEVIRVKDVEMNLFHKADDKRPYMANLSLRDAGSREVEYWKE